MRREQCGVGVDHQGSYVTTVTHDALHADELRANGNGDSGAAAGGGGHHPGAAAEAPAARSPRRRALAALRWALPVLVALVAAGVPLLRWARLALDGPGTVWLGADIAQMELRTLAAGRGRLTLGAFSVYGWQHLGPTLFYWLAPFYAVAGHEPAGMALGAAVANVVGLVALVALVRRFAGEVGAWIAAAAVVAFLWRYGLHGLWVPWNPTLAVVPMALLLVAVAGTMAGHRWTLPLVAGLATWQVQAHLGTAVAVVGACTLAAGAVVVDVRRGGLAPWRRPLLAGLAVGTLLWAGPAVDQVAGIQNMTTVGRYMVTGEMGPGAATYATSARAFTPRQAAGEVGLVGSLLAGDETGRFVGPDRWYSRATERAARTTVAFPLLVLANAAAGVAGFRRGRRFGPALCGTVVVTAALAYLSVAMARGGASHHIVAFVAGIGLVAWLALALEAAGWVGDRRAARAATQPAPARRPGNRPSPLGVGAAATVVVAALVSTSLLVERPAPTLPHNPAYDDIAAAVAGVAEGTTLLDIPGNEAALLVVVTALTEDGYDVRVPPARQLSFTREQYAPATWDTSVWVGLGGRRPPGTGWAAADTAVDAGGNQVTIYTRPGPR